MRAFGGVVDRTGAVGLEGVGIVPQGDEQVAVLVKLQVATGVAAGVVVGDVHQHLLRGHVHGFFVHLELRQPLQQIVLAALVRQVVHRVDQPVLGKVGVEGHRNQAKLDVFGRREHFKLGHFGHFPGAYIHPEELALALGDHGGAVVLGHIKAHRLVQVIHQNVALEAAGVRFHLGVIQRPTFGQGILKPPVQVLQK